MATNSSSGNGSGGLPSGLRSVLDELPVDRLRDELRNGLTALGERAVQSAGDKLTDFAGRLDDVTEGGGVIGKAAQKGAEEAVEGGSPVKGALKGGLSGAKDKIKQKLGGSGGEKGTRSTNIIEEIDVGVPVGVAYNQWTQFQDYSNFMKKVDSVEQEDEVKVNFKAQVFWSHRRWEATILEQVPDEKIVWRSKGEKGHVDGTVTFHELAPRLTRILVVLEYYPQGLFERTGNLWRAQGRRARLELKHFRRHVMTQVILAPDEVEGWRGEISEGEVVRDHDEVVEDEQQREDDDEGREQDEYDEADEPEDEAEEPDESDEPEDEDEEPEDEAEEYDGPEDEYGEDEAEAEEPAGEYEEAEEESAEEPEEAYEEGEEPEEEYAAEDEYEEEPEEEPEDEEPESRPRRRRRASSTR